MISRIASVALSSVILILGQNATAAADSCEIALVLALDVSKSMDPREFSLQFGGTAEALRDPEVQSAILARRGLVAMTAFEWSGKTHQAKVKDWTLLRTPEDVEVFADTLVQHDRIGHGQRTGTGSALEFAYALLDQGPDCDRSIIDVSSDGYSNDGIAPPDVYASRRFDSVTVNALVVGGKMRPFLWDYFSSDIIFGPDAFSMATESFDDYAQAIKEKLLRELAPPALVARSER